MNAELCRVDFEERQHDRMQAAREEDYTMRAESIIDDLADDIVSGSFIVGCDERIWWADDFVDDHTDLSFAYLVTCRDPDNLAAMQGNLRKIMACNVKTWLRDSNEGQSIVEREMEDA